MQPYIIKALQDIEYAYFNNTKLFKTLLDNRIVMDGRFQQLTVSDRVTVQVAVRHPTIKNFQFDIIDTWVLDAIGSLYDNGIFYDEIHRKREELRRNRTIISKICFP